MADFQQKTRLIWPAPAKINLFLHVLQRRADGYHNLQTAFQFLDFADELRFAIRTDGRLYLHANISGLSSAQNLVMRAAKLLQDQTGCAYGADIWLEKRIPLGAGLGGGSSDAATTLVALNELWGLRQPVSVLRRWALTLGADVPVFVQGQAAWAEGVGELLEPIQPLTPWYVLLVPEPEVSTHEIFAAPELTRRQQASTMCAALTQDAEGGYHWWGVNDCEQVVRDRYPSVAEAIDWLNQFAPARMSGTGSSVFAPFATRAEAERVAMQVPARRRCFVVQGRNESGLLQTLQRSQRRSTVIS